MRLFFSAFFFLTFAVFNIAEARVLFHESKDSPFMRDKNVLRHEGDDYVRGRGFVSEDPAARVGYKPADPKFQEGYMYAKLFEAGGLGYFDAASHPERDRVAALAREIRYREIPGILAPYINKRLNPTPKDLNSRWYKHKFEWYRKVFEGGSRDHQGRKKGTWMNQDPANGFIYYYDGATDKTFALFKPSSWTAVATGSRDKARSKRVDKNERIQFAVFDLARQMGLDDALVIGAPAVVTYGGKKIEGILEPFYALPEERPLREETREECIECAVVDAACKVTGATFGRSKAGNVCAKIKEVSVAGSVHIPTMKRSSREVIKIQHAIDQRSLARAILLSFIMWQQDAHSNNFITYWEAPLHKMRVKGLDFEDALDLAEIRKRNLKFQNPREKMLPYVDHDVFVDDELIQRSKTWSLPLLKYYLKLYGIPEESIEAFKERVDLVRAGLHLAKESSERDSDQASEASGEKFDVTYHTLLDATLSRVPSSG